MRLQWEEDDGAETPKISADAKKLLAEYLRFWVTEALERASMQAQINDDEKVEPTHIENMLAGGLLPMLAARLVVMSQRFIRRKEEDCSVSLVHCTLLL